MEGAVKLRCRNDHFEMAEWQIRAVAGGIVVYVACDFGDHYLTPGGAQLEPHVWPDSVAAFGAVERWRQDHQQ